MNTPENFDDDLFADLISEPEGRNEKNTFQPWHNPRKQLVRKEQWVHFIKQNYEKMLSDRKTIKYFSLPGDDLLDIRLIHNEVCSPLGLKLKFVGFNDHADDPAREQNANLSLAEVRAMPSISEDSVYYQNDILHIGQFKSLAYSRIKEGGDYDVVNLDFCDSITSKDPSNGPENHYQLLKQIISIQRSRDEPWLLFITTRIGMNHTHAKALNLLNKCYDDNLKDFYFKNESKEIFNIENIENLIKELDNGKLFNKIICTSLSKWLLSFSLTFTPQISIKVLDAMEYTVLPDAIHPDMISIAFLFKPHPHELQDMKGLAPSTKKCLVLKEAEIAARYINRFNKTTNCDLYLSSDEMKREEVILESQRLLESARFNVSNYRDHFN